MKIWLNDLKPGDRFWDVTLNDALEFEIIGDAHNMNFKMSRFKIKDIKNDIELETFVNHYVYSTQKEAIEELLADVIKRRIIATAKKMEAECEIHDCEEIINRYKNYDEQNIEENIGKS